MRSHLCFKEQEEKKQFFFCKVWRKVKKNCSFERRITLAGFAKNLQNCSVETAAICCYETRQLLNAVLMLWNYFPAYLTNTSEGQVWHSKFFRAEKQRILENWQQQKCICFKNFAHEWTTVKDDPSEHFLL